MLVDVVLRWVILKKRTISKDGYLDVQAGWVTLFRQYQLCGQQKRTQENGGC
jgi:hypothetical protein